MSRWIARLPALFVALVLISAIALVIDQIQAIGYVFEENYNEGWNVYNAERLIAHEVIYDANYWRVNNYPLFSFLLVAAVNLLVHDPLLSGRIVAAVAVAALGVLAGAATRRLGGDRIDAVFGGACALAFCYLMAPAWIAVDDPQTLAEALMLGAFVTYLSNRRSPRALALAALLTVCAGFTKHNAISVPLAVSLDLALSAPRLLVVWLTACSGLAAAFLLLTQLIAGGAFLDHLLSPHVYIWYNVHYHLMKFVRLFKFPLAVVLLGCRSFLPSDRRVLAAYGIVSIVSGAFLSGFDGTSYNMFQDSAAFLGIAAGVVLCDLRKRVLSRHVPVGMLLRVTLPVAAIVLAQPIWSRAPAAFGKIYHLDRMLAAHRGTERAFLEDVSYVVKKQGVALCESLLMCHEAGQPFILDPFNSRQYILAGRLDQNELIRRIASHDFAVIQLRAEICDDRAASACHILHYPRKFNRFTDEVLYAVDRYYRIDRRSAFGVFYVPS